MPATQMFLNQLNFVAGFFGRGMLQKVLKVASGSVAYAVAGRCGYIDNNGEWVHGLPPANRGPAMFVFRGVNQPDVLNDGTTGSVNIAGGYWWVSGNAQGFVTCLPATGGFELQTTEFDVTQTYQNGQALTVDGQGRLTNQNATPYTNVIVGYAAPFQQYPENMRPAAGAALGPVAQNAHGVRVLNFYTTYLPRTS
jgi:hypothetical protein